MEPLHERCYYILQNHLLTVIFTHVKVKSNHLKKCKLSHRNGLCFFGLQKARAKKPKTHLLKIVVIMQVKKKYLQNK